MTSADESSSRPMRIRYRVLTCSAEPGQEENVLRVFDDLAEAQAFVRFLESGGAFASVRIESLSTPRKKLASSDDVPPARRPGELAKLVFILALLLGLVCGGAVGAFVAIALVLPSKLYFYCIAGFAVAGAAPAYWIMSKWYGPSQ